MTSSTTSATMQPASLGAQAPEVAVFAQLRSALAGASRGVVRVQAPAAWLGALQRHVMRSCGQALRKVAAVGGMPASRPWWRLAQDLQNCEADERPQATATIDDCAWLSVDRLNSLWGDHVLLVLDYSPAVGTSDWQRVLQQRFEGAALDPRSRVLVVLLEPLRDASHDEGSVPSLPGAERLGTLPRMPNLPQGHEDAGPSGESKAVDLRLRFETLGHEDRRYWWEALAFERANQDSFQQHDLAQLDAWSSHALRIGSEAACIPPRATARELLGCLVVAGRPLPEDFVRAADESEEMDALEASGWVERTRDGSYALVDTLRVAGLLAAAEPRQGAAVGERRRRAVRCGQALAASGLAGSGLAGSGLRGVEAELDAWMRAAELFVEAGDLVSAEHQAFRALDACADTALRDQLWRRWHASIALTGAAGAPSSTNEACGLAEALLRACEKALSLGDSDIAGVCLRSALRRGGESYRLLLLHGKASRAHDDLTTSTLVLTRAIQMAADADSRAAAYASLAETRYAAGDLGSAKSHAEKAAAETTRCEVRLAARNVLGKLMLGREDWQSAESHYAADAFDAASAGLVEHELRANLNRGIAIMSMGRRSEAERIYRGVLENGRAAGNMRAVAYAYSNLASVVMLQHRYAESLDYSTKAIQTRREIGERVQSMVVPLANLVQLRQRLGLYDEAKQALRFGRSLLSKASPVSRGAYFAKADALLHVELGDLAVARQQLEAFRAGAESLGGAYLLSQCERLAARIAIEEGDVLAAERALVAARGYNHNKKGQAEVELLDAMWRRAAGKPFADAAKGAVEAAKHADDIELLREALVVLHHAHRNAAENSPHASKAATEALVAAIKQRERMLSRLPPALQRSYLKRFPLRNLADYEAAAGTVHAPAGADGLGLAVGGTPAAAARNSRGERANQPARLVGQSPAMVALRQKVARVARTEATILVHGPTGTGKELVAEAIHAKSRRSAGPLVKVNCAALVETLLLSELFGHEKGAFTGAASRRRGRFEMAEGGTLFLDEIGDISARTQVALLRVLQDGSFERVGGCSPHRANVRVVCATHRDLAEMVKRGEFREDLYYRLAGMVVTVPALHEHAADVPQLVKHFVQRASQAAGVEAKSIEPEALALLAQYAWPGNVRELENAVRAATLFAEGETISWADFRSNVRALTEFETLRYAKDGTMSQRPAPKGDASAVVYEEVRSGLGLAAMKKKLERDCIARALVDSGGNITRAAKLLGMKRPRLSQLVKQYELTTMLQELKSC